MIAEYGLLLSFLLTVSIELVIVGLLYKKPSLATITGGVILIHALTHPLGIGIGVHVLGIGVLLAEIAICIVEALWYWRVFEVRLRYAALLSLVANIASYSIGTLMWSLVG